MIVLHFWFLVGNFHFGKPFSFEEGFFIYENQANSSKIKQIGKY